MTWFHTHWQEIFSFLFQALVAVFGGGSLMGLLPKLPALTEAAFTWLVSKAKTSHNTWVASVLSHIVVVVRQQVLKAENTEIERLKTMAANGQLTQAQLVVELARVKQSVLEEIKSHLNVMGLMKLALSIFSDSASFHTFLDHAVEAEVAQLPASGLQSGPDVAPVKVAEQEAAPTAAPVAPVTPPPAAA